MLREPLDLCNSLSMTRDANNGHTLQGSDVAEHEDSLNGKLDMSIAQSLLECIRASKSQDKNKRFYNCWHVHSQLHRHNTANSLSNSASASAVAECVQHFITAMDSLRLNMVALDQVHPLLSNQ